jgi:uncharacterized protein YxjI
MRYVMREKLWAIGGDFTVRDADGVDRFYVDGKALSLPHEIVFQDMARRPLATLRHRLLSLTNVYDIYHGDDLFAVVKEGWMPLVRYRFSVDVAPEGPGTEDLTITGDFWNREYTFERDGRTVATVSRKWFAWRDTFGVDVADDADAVLVLACTVVVDLCTRKKSDE